MKLFLFDMGLPMIMPSIVLMVVALLPIVFLESYFVGTTLRLNLKKVLAPVALANLVSTFIGIPVTWFLLMLLEFASVNVLGAFTDGPIWTKLFSITLGAPWVAPGHPDETWIILGAMLFLLIPYGVASWGVEYLIIRKIMLEKKENDSPIDASLQHLRRAVGKANFASYCLLAVFVIAVFAGNLFVSNY